MGILAKIAHLIFHYYSTSCLHKEHEYCQKAKGVAGVKKPSECKFCGKPCKCWCHRISKLPIKPEA